jgi:integrase/recombinase XerC
MRDHALLSFLCNSGARIQEALDLCPEAIRFDTPSCVRRLGKGRKERICPLRPETVVLLKKLLERQPRAPNERMFVNRYGEPLSASGVPQPRQRCEPSNGTSAVMEAGCEPARLARQALK